MSTLASALKGEIARISRKETKQQVTPVRTATTRNRSEIAELKRQVAELQRQLSQVQKGASKVAEDAAEEQGTQRRFRTDSIATLRSRLDVSATELASLLGVTSQTVYNWSAGTSRPLAKQLEALAELRTIGKREAAARLEALAQKPQRAAKKKARKRK